MPSVLGPPPPPYSVRAFGAAWERGCLSPPLCEPWLRHWLSCIINLTKQFNFYIVQDQRAVIQLYNDTLLNRNDEEWPHTRQIKTVEECDFDQQFLFDEYMAISHRYELKIISLKSYINVLSSYVKIELFNKSKLMMHESLLNFHSAFLDTLYRLYSDYLDCSFAIDAILVDFRATKNLYSSFFVVLCQKCKLSIIQ